MADESMENGELLAATADKLGSGDSMNMSNQSDGIDDPDIEVIQERIKEMEEEAEKIKQMQSEIEEIAHGTPALSIEEKMEMDARSIYVGNVDYEATSEELEAHFHGCGSINRISIQCDKFSGNPKGFAYIEFADRDSVITSTALDESLLRGRQIKVLPKRTNRPGISSTNRPLRGRQTRVLPNYPGANSIYQPPRSRFRRPSRSYFGGYRPVMRSYRRRSWYYPY